MVKYFSARNEGTFSTVYHNFFNGTASAIITVTVLFLALITVVMSLNPPKVDWTPQKCQKCQVGVRSVRRNVAVPLKIADRRHYL